MFGDAASGALGRQWIIPVASSVPYPQFLDVTAH
jgi:hypothetical protein